MSKRVPNYDYTGSEERVLVGFAVGPDLRVFRDGEDLELLEGSTLILSPGDQVLSQEPIEHALLADRKNRKSSDPVTVDATEEESTDA